MTLMCYKKIKTIFRGKECHYNIKDGEAGLEAFFKEAFQAQEEGKEGSQTLISCIERVGERSYGHSVSTNWGPGQHPGIISMVS